MVGGLPALRHVRGPTEQSARLGSDPLPVARTQPGEAHREERSGLRHGGHPDGRGPTALKFVQPALEQALRLPDLGHGRRVDREADGARRHPQRFGQDRAGRDGDPRAGRRRQRGQHHCGPAAAPARRHRPAEPERRGEAARCAGRDRLPIRAGGGAGRSGDGGMGRDCVADVLDPLGSGLLVGHRRQGQLELQQEVVVLEQPRVSHARAP
jgi:hypothetical protein